ncbi:MAG TPA: hypothetical protein VFJ16_00315 [Longimicrobium sp.]|nr:hypothetical protein [Longimicrobium sp.]
MDEAATRNELQTTFFEQLGVEEVVESDGEPPYLTWVLLVARMDEGLAIELSLVGALGADGRGEYWLERIVLPTMPLDGDFGVPAIPLAPEPGPEFEVSVTKKIAS